MFEKDKPSSSPTPNIISFSKNYSRALENCEGGGYDEVVMVINQQQSTILRPVLALALLAGLTAASSAQIGNLWRFDGSAGITLVEEDSLYNGWQNPSGASAFFAPGTIVSIRAQKITGYNGGFGPVWTSKFDPLTDQTTSYDCAPNGKDVPAGKRLTAWVKWTHEAASYTNRYGYTSITATRDRNWNDFHSRFIEVY